MTVHEKVLSCPHCSYQTTKQRYYDRHQRLHCSKRTVMHQCEQCCYKTHRRGTLFETHHQCPCLIPKSLTTESVNVTENDTIPKTFFPCSISKTNNIPSSSVTALGNSANGMSVPVSTIPITPTEILPVVNPPFVQTTEPAPIIYLAGAMTQL
ncbi:hypothetical protein CEXT_362371 [Caerostris extrusa]|uniref:C2H2-type domain-containing protein n=1 Tax=Caerostris extrusa TaxID=172846 RepID=A0AAV4WUT4_CAEEX|nr:hypothetical protein CEXT_362371 [Caerostris extrusa]